MKRLVAPVLVCSALLLGLGLPGRASAQNEPLSIITAGLSCTNGVCDLGTGNVGTFLNLGISSSGGSGPTPFKWRVVNGKLPAGLKMARFFGVESTEITGTPTTAGTYTFTVAVTDNAGTQATEPGSITIS